MPVYWLDEYTMQFPNPELADANGLIAVGGDLDPVRLLEAYRQGIFPWYESSAGDFYWFSTHPRCVLYPKELKVHKSMRSIFNQKKFTYSLDTQFKAVMEACSKIPRDHESGSWISTAFIEGYSALHELGFAHSVEVWDGDMLVGGLYGVSLGNVFYGESMFARKSNASKAGFITLVQALEKTGFSIIDCQQRTNHLTSLGARMISRQAFLDAIRQNQMNQTLRGKWTFAADGTVQVR